MVRMLRGLRRRRLEKKMGEMIEQVMRETGKSREAVIEIAVELLGEVIRGERAGFFCGLTRDGGQLQSKLGPFLSTGDPEPGVDQEYDPED
jgi:hypothetical protein